MHDEGETGPSVAAGYPVIGPRRLAQRGCPRVTGLRVRTCADLRERDRGSIGYYRSLTGQPPGGRNFADVAAALELPPAAPPPTGRLAAVGSVDDPVVGHNLVALGSRLGAARPDLYFHDVRRGGHGAFPVIHQTLSRKFLLTFFCSGPWTC